MSGWRLGIYRAIQRDWIGRRIAPWVLRGRARFAGEADEIRRVRWKARKPGVRRAWFHAASVGELECLWSVVEAIAARGPVELVLTVFSESARKSISRLKE